MASTKTTVYFTFVILVAVLVVTASAKGNGRGGRGGRGGASRGLTAPRGGGSFCGEADDKVLCGQLTGGATTWGAAMATAINGALVRVNAGRSTVDIIGAKLPRNLKPITKQSLTGTCRENLANAVDNLEQCLVFLKSDPTSALNSYLSSITFSDCTDGLEEFGLSVPEATQFANDVLRIASTLLAVSAARK